MGAPKKKSRAAACVRIVTGNNYKSMCSRKWFARAFQLFSKVKVETSLEMVWPLVLHPKLPGQKAIPYTEKEKNILHFNCSGFLREKKRPLVSPTSFYPEWFYNWSLRARPFSNCPFCPVSFSPPSHITPKNATGHDVNTRTQYNQLSVQG